MKFKKNNKMGKGGNRKGAGRPPLWFHHVCSEELAKDRYKAVQIIGRIARGEQTFEKVFNDKGNIVRAIVGPTPSDIIMAAEYLRDSGIGKPTQIMEHSGKDGEPIVVQVVKYAS